MGRQWALVVLVGAVAVGPAATGAPARVEPTVRADVPSDVTSASGAPAAPEPAPLAPAPPQAVDEPSSKAWIVLVDIAAVVFLFFVARPLVRRIRSRRARRRAFEERKRSSRHG